MNFGLTPTMASEIRAAMARASRPPVRRPSPRGVYGLAEVAALRRAGRKPAAVHIDLVPRVCRWDDTFGDTAIATVEIEHAVSLNDLDLRPLVGLDVHMHTPLPEDAVAVRRHKRLATLLWAIPTSLLVVPMAGPNNSLKLHVRRGNHLETYTV